MLIYWVPILAIMNNAAVYISVYRVWCECMSSLLEYIPRSGVAWSYDNSLCGFFLGTAKLFSTVASPVTFSPAMYKPKF